MCSQALPPPHPPCGPYSNEFKNAPPQLTLCCAPSRPTKLPIPVPIPIAIIAPSTGTSTAMRAIAWIIFLEFMIQQLTRLTVVVPVSTIPGPRIGVVSVDEHTRSSMYSCSMNMEVVEEPIAFEADAAETKDADGRPELRAHGTQNRCGISRIRGKEIRKI